MRTGSDSVCAQLVTLAQYAKNPLDYLNKAREFLLSYGMQVSCVMILQHKVDRLPKVSCFNNLLLSLENRLAAYRFMMCVKDKHVLRV